MKLKKFVLLSFAFFILGSCCKHANDDESYTLYRTSVFEGVGRMHIATFNSKDGDSYNDENCNLAAKLFQNQPYVKTRIWCEKGSYKK